MWTVTRALGALLATTMWFGGQARAEDAFDALVFEQARARGPEVEAAMRSALRAAEDKHLERAVAHYEEALTIAPDFAHALRRKCGLEAALGQLATAETSCRLALDASRTPLNLAALSSVLAELGPGTHADARRLLTEALDGGASDAQALQVATQTALSLGDPALVTRSATLLRAQDPNSFLSYYALGIAAAIREDFNEARDLLELAKQHGLPEPAYASIIDKVDEAQPFLFRILPSATRVGAIWLFALVLFLILGSALSILTLSATLKLPKQVGGEGDGGSRVLRRSYAGVLWLSCLFYYLSLPLLVLTIVGGAGGILYGFIALGRIPIKLVLIVGAVACISVWAVIKSLFVRVKDEDPGIVLDLTSEPDFRALLDEVAAKVGTRPVDRVFLTPGTEIAVFERGGLGDQLRGHAERCLVLGLGVLEGLRINDFKAILAHEYGHFSNRDTAGGGFSLGVRRSMVSMAHALADGGAATWYNPAWWFFNAFYRIFLRISQGASRLQEVLADRWAAFSYGSDAFVRGFEHVIARSVIFNAQADMAVEKVREAKQPLSNFYHTLREQPLQHELVSEHQKQAFEREPSPYDSHPAPRDRIAWVKALAIPEPEAADHAEAWSMFKGREALERDMTHTVNQMLGLHGNGGSPLE